MKRAFQLITAVTLMSMAPCLHCRVGDPVVDIKQRLTSQFRLTKSTFDSLDIVTPGSILVLQKDGMLMCADWARHPRNAPQVRGLPPARKQRTLRLVGMG